MKKKINNPELAEMMAKARAAQKLYASTFTNDQMDEVLFAIGKKLVENAQMLCEEAVAETHMGIIVNKLSKLKLTCAGAYRYAKGQQVLGLIEVDEVRKVNKYAKPIGVIASITPSTNPIATPAQNSMAALKAGNAVIVCPHPAAQKCSFHACELIREALVEVGAPVDLVQCIEHPTIEISAEVMAACDAVVATGGPGMVNAAYSSGTPAFGVGQGNVQCIIDEDYENVTSACANIVINRNYDLGVPCTGDQTVYIPRKREAEVLEAMKKAGAYLVTDPEDCKKIREIVFPNAGPINRHIVGKLPFELNKLLELNYPDVTEETRCFLIKTGDTYDPDDVLNREVLCPILRYRLYDKWEEAVDMAVANLENEGAGHSSDIWTDNADKAKYAGEKLPVGRLMVNQNNINAGGVAYNNGLYPTMTLGCGFWGGNSITENLTFMHLRNFTQQSFVIPDAEPWTAEETFGL